MFARIAWTRETLLKASLTALFLLFVVSLPRFTDTAKTWYVLLILCGFFYLVSNLRELGDSTGPERLFLTAVLLNFLWIAFTFYVNGAPGRGESVLWGRHFYLPFLIGLFLLFRKVEIEDKYILLGLFACILVTLADMLIDLAQGIDHREQGMNPNSLAPIQLCLGATLLYYFLYAKERRLKVWALAGSLLAVAAVIMSGSKNAWLTFLLLTVFFVFYLPGSLTFRKRLVLVIGLILLSSSSYFIPYVKQRIDTGLASIVHNLVSENPEEGDGLGTFGARIELWKEAWHVFLDKPLLGAGVGGIKPMVEANRERYQTSEQVFRHKYVHNQYLAALATRGIPGLILFLAVLTIPLYIAMSNKAFDRDSLVPRLSIITICLVYLLGNIWASHFENKSATMFVGVMLPLWLAKLSPMKAAPGNLARPPTPG